MRVVLDTNVLVRAVPKARGLARQILLELTTRSHTLIISPFILREVRQVLKYPRLRTHWRMTDKDIRGFITELQRNNPAVVKLARGKTSVMISKDPDDNPIIETAVRGRATVLCTLDWHLRTPIVKEYCAEHKIEVMTDIELLRRLRKVK